jgi:hypothetical protein
MIINKFRQIAVYPRSGRGLFLKKVRGQAILRVMNKQRRTSYGIGYGVYLMIWINL